MEGWVSSGAMGREAGMGGRGRTGGRGLGVGRWQGRQEV